MSATAPLKFVSRFVGISMARCTHIAGGANDDCPAYALPLASLILACGLAGGVALADEPARCPQAG